MIWPRYLGMLLLAPLVTPVFAIGALATLAGYGMKMAWVLGLVTYPLVLVIALVSDLTGRLLAHGRPWVHGLVGLLGGLIAFALLDDLFRDMLRVAASVFALDRLAAARLETLSLVAFLASSWISMALMRRFVPGLRSR